MTTVSVVEWITPALTVAVMVGAIVMRRRNGHITVVTLTVTAIVVYSAVDALMSVEGDVDEMIMAVGKPN
jgi:hypothetical protein